MEKTNFNKIKESETSLKIDRDLIELQKTIIFYGDKIIFNLETIIKMLESSYPKKKNNEAIKDYDPLSQLLLNMKIPKGYKGN